MRGGRSLVELNKLARIAGNSNDPAQRTANGRLIFIAISVDPTPHAARAYGPTQWPHLKHHWIDANTIGELDIGFVPNRVIIDGRPMATGRHTASVKKQQHSAAPSFAKSSCSSGYSAPRVLRWWDGTAGNVLKGPHGASRGNGSHQLLDELRDLIATPRTF